MIDALAGGEPVGLDHDGRALRARHGPGGGGVGEMAIGGGRRAAGVADLLGEAFRGLELRRGGGGAEDQQPCLAQAVGDARGQRRLGADDHEIDRIVSPAKSATAPPSVDVEPGAFGDLRDPRIARRHDQRSHLGFCSTAQASACSRPPLPRMRMFMALSRVLPAPASVAAGQGPHKVHVGLARLGRPPFAPARAPLVCAQTGAEATWI